MPNSLKLLNHYILRNAPQKTRQWVLNAGHCSVSFPTSLMHFTTDGSKLDLLIGVKETQARASVLTDLFQAI